jgi:asparagine synthase (glutamine-hydrolysing)
MSAIFGIVSDIGNREQKLSRMSEVLVHRGPDDLGIYADEGIALGCRLLRTRGPKEECQPISSEAGDVQAVLDGAIYNGDILREELERRGRTFQTNSDAELLVYLYME